ncbi:hypothetical protein [Streptomyces sp. NPDC013457]|uniref:hypothetical protein n=1 Tax=Streptomyces sp. NPDC013457 TaxID=3364866 RepID=UPI003701297E
MSHQRDRAADAPGRRRHATKRRTPGPRRLLAGAGVVGVGLLVAVVSGAFRSGQTGGAPAVDDGRPGMPSLIRADPSGDGEESDATGTPSASSSAAARSASESPSASAATSASASVPGSSSATEAPGPTATGGSGSGKPGKSGGAPGQTKRPR